MRDALIRGDQRVNNLIFLPANLSESLKFFLFLTANLRQGMMNFSFFNRESMRKHEVFSFFNRESTPMDTGIIPPLRGVVNH